VPRLVVPKFLAAAAVVSEKIDAVVRELVAVVNGGLDAANIAPTTRFPKAAFLDPSALFAVVETMVSPAGANPSLTLLRFPAAGRVVAWSIRVATGSSLTDVKLIVNGVEVDASGPLAQDAEVLRMIEPAVAADLGHVVTVTTTAGAGTTFTVTLFALADHVA
jgi:hypothetical protein